MLSRRARLNCVSGQLLVFWFVPNLAVTRLLCPHVLSNASRRSQSTVSAISLSTSTLGAHAFLAAQRLYTQLLLVCPDLCGKCANLFVCFISCWKKSKFDLINSKLTHKQRFILPFCGSWLSLSRIQYVWSNVDKSYSSWEVGKYWITGGLEWWQERSTGGGGRPPRHTKYVTTQTKQ